MILGNIVSNKKIDEDPCFAIYSLDEEIKDKTIPTIYIGYLDISDMFEYLDSTNRNISENVFWTFYKNENNKYFLNDLFNFKIYCYNYKIKNLNYQFINPFKNISDIKKIISFLSNKKFKTVITNNKMIYFYNDGTIYGYDLNFNDYCGIDSENLINKIKNKSTIFLNENELTDDIVHFIEIIDDKKYASFLVEN